MEQRYCSTLSLTSALDGVVNATPRQLYPRKRPGTHCSWVCPRAGLDECIKSRPPQGFDLRSVQPAAIRPAVTNKPSVGFPPNPSQLPFPSPSVQAPSVHWTPDIAYDGIKCSSSPRLLYWEDRCGRRRQDDAECRDGRQTAAA